MNKEVEEFGKKQGGFVVPCFFRPPVFNGNVNIRKRCTLSCVSCAFLVQYNLVCFGIVMASR